MAWLGCQGGAQAEGHPGSVIHGVPYLQDKGSYKGIRVPLKGSVRVLQGYYKDTVSYTCILPKSETLSVWRAL